MSKKQNNTKPVKFKVRPGMICSFDPANNLKQKDTEISHVIVHKRLKYRLFNKSIWIVQNADDPQSDRFTCPEFLLEPENVIVIRIPTNIPEFSDIDVDAISYIYNVLNSNPNMLFEILCEYNTSNDISMHKDRIRLYIKRLSSILEKIKFCKEMRDV